jgi:hypothetical protein
VLDLLAHNNNRTGDLWPPQDEQDFSRINNWLNDLSMSDDASAVMAVVNVDINVPDDQRSGYYDDENMTSKKGL